MTRYTTIDNKEISKGTMKAAAIESYCAAHNLTKPPVFAVAITADYVNRRPFNWETREFERAGIESDPYGEMGGK
jgi:hypothetical protein